MHSSLPGAARTGRLLALAAVTLAMAACSDQIAAPGGEPLATVPETTLQMFDCTATRESMSCAPLAPRTGDARGVILGVQNVSVRLASSNAGYNPGTEIFSVDVTVQNLLNEAIGTPDGITPDAGGVKVFFFSEPAITGGTGEVTVENEDSTDFFTGPDQPFHRYSEVLETNEVSAVKTWQFHMDPGVTGFRFTVALETSVQLKLVINEVMANPSPPVTSEQPYEWFELYNAGSLPVDLQGLVIADSAASGRRPYHLIASSVVVQPGGYVVLGGSSNTTDNGGVPVDYSYGTALNQLANSLDAVKIARVVGMDTLTLDRTQYSNASVSAKDGISRELKNPALDNSNMDGSNWGDASVTSVYGSGGRGTPKAQNSVFTP
ncbi:lamin tail domain-containing protein [Longimicrobium sp.]|uniref:lamin tail domain-containing protein n=1 Tax=Longimicrobium sp. TaxID=2029185 RepID=UPI002E37FD61|nr:lamin tail domain-containing protein [Longimicrobium sp.]HEX6038785.1 lamin tail domain-containing protein [Longimicrobium sp.]